MFEPGDFENKSNNWQKNCVCLKQRGSTLLKVGAYCDIKLIVGRDPESREIFEGHKLVLAMASPVFEVIFYKDENVDTIHIGDVQPEPFRAMLNYIYSENINLNSYDTARDLYYCATKFMLLQLARVCVTFMGCNVNPWNACHALQMGHVCDEQVLIDEALMVIKSNIEDILHHKSFYEVDVSTIATILSIEDLKVENELQLFLALKQYAQARTSSSEQRKRKGSPRCEVGEKKRKLNDSSSKIIQNPENTKNEKGKKETSSELLMPSLQPAVSAIRFLTLSSEQFVQHVARSGLLTARDALALLANILSEDARLPVPDGFSDKRQPRMQQRPLPRPLAASQTELTRRMVVGNIDRQWALAMPPTVESRCFELAARRWSVRLVPRRECSTSSQVAECFVGVFLRCLDPLPAPWSCRLAAQFRLLAARPADLPMSSRLDQTFTSATPEWGFTRFIRAYELRRSDTKFVSNNTITIDVFVKVINTAS